MSTRTFAVKRLLEHSARSAQDAPRLGLVWFNQRVLRRATGHGCAHDHVKVYLVDKRVYGPSHATWGAHCHRPPVQRPKNAEWTRCVPHYRRLSPPAHPRRGTVVSSAARSRPHAVQSGWKGALILALSFAAQIPDPSRVSGFMRRDPTRASGWGPGPRHSLLHARQLALSERPAGDRSGERAPAGLHGAERGRAGARAPALGSRSTDLSFDRRQHRD